MLRLILFFCLFIVYGCGGSISENELDQLNGYWEIKEVKFPDGNTKAYDTNPTIDYIQLENRTGFRKKMQPKLDGTFDTSKDIKSFTLIEKEGSFFFLYENELSQWQEKLIRLEADSFTVLNVEDITYTYQRHEPINVLQ